MSEWKRSSRSPYNLKRVMPSGYGTHYEMQGKCILGLYRTYGMFRGRMKGREKKSSRLLGKDQSWENWWIKGYKGTAVCKLAAGQYTCLTMVCT